MSKDSKAKKIIKQKLKSTEKRKENIRKINQKANLFGIRTSI